MSTVADPLTEEALPDTCSKADELAHWQTFLGQLPPCSYLALYLNGSTPILEDAIRNDMSVELAQGFPLTSY